MISRRELFKGFIAVGIAGGVVSKLPTDTPKISALPLPAPIPEMSELLYIDDGSRVCKKITLGELKEYLNS